MSRLTIAEGSVALLVLYALIGGGIGAAAGSPMLGFAVGLLTGIAAIASILLISGASASARDSVDRVIRPFPRHASHL